MKNWDERVLVISPHADDETLGAGGLLATLGAKADVAIVTIGRPPAYRLEERDQSEDELREALRTLGVRGFVLIDGSQGFLDTLGQARLVAEMDELIKRIRPTAVFLPYASHHQDHRATYEAGIAALRPSALTVGVRLVALYEYPYASTWPAPELPGGKFHFALDAGAMEKKMAALRAYRRLLRKDAWLSPERVEAWTRMRGAEVGVDAAEAFWVVRGWL